VSLPVRAVVLFVAFLCVVGVGVFVAVYYIGAANQLPTVVYTASGGHVNVVLQEDPGNNSTTTPSWVTYYTQDPDGQWLHTTLFQVPADTRVDMTIYGYDGCTPLRNNYWSQIQGTLGNVVAVQQFNKNNRPLGSPTVKSVINSWASCSVAHTFAIPDIGLYVPVASPNANNSVNNLCGTFPCTPTSGGAYSLEKFSFMSPSQPGSYRWQCLIPCGGGFLDGNGGPMQTLGWMAGFMNVVST
jgi:hypothetical protein